VLDQPSTRLHQPLLQARQGPLLNPPRRCQPSPLVAQIVSDRTQPELLLVGPKSVVALPSHYHRLLVLLDRLRHRASLVVEPHACAAKCACMLEALSREVDLAECDRGGHDTPFQSRQKAQQYGRSVAFFRSPYNQGNHLQAPLDTQLVT
jgi:hypothetical protein